MAGEPGRPNRRGTSAARAPWGTISRDRIIDAALQFVTEQGYQNLTVRALAARLGVAPMSLYRHVRGKDDLLDEVVDRLLATAWRPRARESDWRGWLTQAADLLRRFLVDQPAALQVYLTHPVVSPTAVTRMQAMLRVLRRVTTDETTAHKAYAAIHTYTIGFAALEASRADWQPPSAGRNDRLAHQLAAYTTPRQFTEGLGYLLDAIAGHAATGSE